MWSPLVKPGSKAPIVLVKIHIPRLLVNFIMRIFFDQIARNVAKVLKIDLVTLQVTSAIVALVTVEADFRNFLPECN